MGLKKKETGWPGFSCVYEFDFWMDVPDNSNQ